MEATELVEIGRVLRASTEGFTCGTRSQDINHPSFGTFVQTHHEDDLIVIGIITAIRIDDDPLVRQLIMASDVNESALRDQRENRLVPVEVDILNIGYIQADRIFYSLPPRPPLSLDPVMLCDEAMIEYFTQKLDFLRLILNGHTNGLGVDLLGATICHAAKIRQTAAEENRFRVDAGRQVAALLSHDMSTLRYILSIIRPV